MAHTHAFLRVVDLWALCLCGFGVVLVAAAGLLWWNPPEVAEATDEVAAHPPMPLACSSDRRVQSLRV